MIYRLILLLCLVFAAPVHAQPAQHPHLAWTRNANIYEVNIRQYTQEGTIKAFEKHLPRLKRMGVKILWIMPVQPIGEKNRKGTMGSYYSISDYTAVNPEFGSMDDFKQLVRTAHAMDMKVILDWVANHTAWDSEWAKTHPEWFKRNAKGELTSYEYNNGREIEYWTDVIGLDYQKPEVWGAMIGAMKFWIKEANIDGFRCDVASLMPVPFWQRARAELDAIKPMFMLAESDDPAIHVAFDMTYDWKLFDAFAEIAQGKADAQTLRNWVSAGQKGFPGDAYRMAFTSNHDVNSWRWSDQELYGEKFRAFAALAATLPGMPLIYSGQESGLNKKVAFFEKDPIEWRDYANSKFYQWLLNLKTRHPALANGSDGGKVQLISGNDKQVFAFERIKGRHKIRVFANLSSSSRFIPEAAKTVKPWDVLIVEK
jgi:glycosidase